MPDKTYQPPAEQLPDGDEQPKHPGGRPLKFGTAAELDLAIQNYFAECDPHTTQALVETGRDSKGNMLFDTRTVLTEQQPYKITGLARTLGITRQTLINYGERQEFFDTVRDARQKCEEWWEGALASQYANGAKFNLNVNHGWTETKNIDHTTAGESIVPVVRIIDERQPNRNTDSL